MNPPLDAPLNGPLMLGAALSAIASLLHLAIIAGGPAWYRFFRAGERLARQAEAGRWTPVLITLGIALVLALWSAYALAGAGALPPLPALKPALCLITAIYLLRGFVIVPIWLLAPAQASPFAVWSSLICLGYGLAHLLGLAQTWDRL